MQEVAFGLKQALSGGCGEPFDRFRPSGPGDEAGMGFILKIRIETALNQNYLSCFNNSSIFSRSSIPRGSNFEIVSKS